MYMCFYKHMKFQKQDPRLC